MIKFLLIIIFTFSPPDEEPITYELVNQVDSFENCLNFTNYLKKYILESDYLKIQTHCYITKENAYSFLKVNNRKKYKFDSYKMYDPYGKYKGTIENGKIYSPYGKYKGRIESNGKIYSPYGKYEGKISK